MVLGVVAVVLFYVVGDKSLAKVFLKAQAGGYQPAGPEMVSTMVADTVNAPVTGADPTIVQATAGVADETASPDFKGQPNPLVP